MPLNLFDDFFLPTFSSILVLQLILAISSKVGLSLISDSLKFIKDIWPFMDRDMLKAERTLLKALDYDLNLSCSFVYLRGYLATFGWSLTEAYLAKYYLEISLLDYQFSLCRQDCLALAAMWLAHQTLFNMENNNLENLDNHWLR